ncbi:MAG TPA: circularly permuted type 2 ATP-grasp protein [Trebonia sp.]
MADTFDGYQLADAWDEMFAAPAANWELVSRGARQRVLAVEAFLADVYGPGHAFEGAVVPWNLVCASDTFRREVAGFAPPNGVRCQVSSIDLSRDERGTFRVLEDNVQVPSGVSGVIENRLAMTRLLAALRSAAPPGVADPFVVVLTPGARTAAYLEDALLARRLGLELVEGRDLFCWRNRVYVHTRTGRRPVDVIYRRVDDGWLDPMQFRPDSTLGCPGLVNAARAGNVTIANAVGNGVADGARVSAYMPDLIRYYLGQEPVLENMESGRPAGEKPACRHAGLRLFAVNDGNDVWVLPGGRVGEEAG